MAKDFPPTIKEVMEYAKEKGYKDFPAEDFMDYYGARDWFMPRNVKMRVWKNAVNLWGRRQQNAGKKISVLDQMERDGLI